MLLLLLTDRLVWSAPPSPDESEIRRRVGEIYAREEFGHGAPDLVQSLAEVLARFFEWLSALEGNHPYLRGLIFIACILLLILVAVHIGWTVTRVFYVGRRGRLKERAAEEHRLRSQAFLDQAQERARAQDYTEAIRLLFLSLIYRFDEKGRVSFQRSYTNREYLRLFSDRPVLHDKLSLFVDELDDNWYGLRATSREEFESCLAHYRRLQ